MSDTEQEKSKLDKAMTTALSVLGDGTVYNTISEALNTLNAKPMAEVSPTVTISRESAKIARSKIQETLGQSERFYAGMPDSKMTRGEFNRIMEKEIAAVDELTKAMEVKGE